MTGKYNPIAVTRQSTDYYYCGVKLRSKYQLKYLQARRYNSWYTVARFATGRKDNLDRWLFVEQCCGT